MFSQPQMYFDLLGMKGQDLEQETLNREHSSKQESGIGNILLNRNRESGIGNILLNRATQVCLSVQVSFECPNAQVPRVSGCSRLLNCAVSECPSAFSAQMPFERPSSGL